MPQLPHNLRSPAALGINESSRPELLAFGTSNLRQVNIRQFRNGEAATRYGFTGLPNTRLDASSPSVGYKMFAERDSIVRIVDGQAEVFSYKAQRWAPLGRVPEASARLIDLPTMGTLSYLEDIDATNGYVAISWLSLTGASASAYLAIVDQVTGAVMRAPELVGTSTDVSPSLLAVQGNYFVTVRYNSTGTKIQAWYLDTTSAATITTGWVAFGASLATDAGGVRLAVHSLPDVSTPRVALLYGNTSGGTDRLTLKTFNVGGVVQTKTILTDSVTPVTFSLGGFSTDTLWLVWDQTTGIWVRGVSPFTITSDLATRLSLFSVTTSSVGVSVAASTALGKARVWADDSAANKFAIAHGVKTSAGAAASDGAGCSIPGVKMSRKPFFYNGRYYSAFVNLAAGSAQNNFFVADWTDDSVGTVRPIANPAPGLASVGLYGFGKFVSGTVASIYVAGLGIRRSAIADGDALVELDFLNSERWHTAAHGNAAFIAAALPAYSDGARIAEVGFLYRPSQPATGTSLTGITAITGWRYVAVFEETDASGNWCVSGLSDPSASTGAVANKTVTVTSIPMAITSRLGTAGAARGVRVAWYRTLDGGQAPYYRLGTTANDPTAATATYTDTTTDATLATASVLYSQPGVLGTSQDRRPPPFFSCIVSYNGMLVGASGSDVWYSGQNVAGEATWFNPIFQIPVPGTGNITALAVMDGVLYVFKRKEVYVLAGDAPSDNGSSGGLGLPRRMACDVGCIDSRTTCTTALGVFFQSERGIEVLTRAQTVQWIGQHVQQTLATYPVVTSITVVPNMSGAAVYVECAATEFQGVVSGNGRTLVFDLSTSAWVSTDIRASAVSATEAPSQSACIVYTGTSYRYAWMAWNGHVHYEDTTTCLDANGSFVVPLIETGWYNAYQNEQRVRSASVLFQPYTAAGLKVESAYDFGAYDSLDDSVWTELEVLGERQLELAATPRGETAKFRITATAPASLGTGQGFGFIGLVLDIAAKQGPTKGTLRLDPEKRR